VNTNIDNEIINDLSQEYWDMHAKMMSEYQPLEVAAILMAHSLTLYKTVLSDDGYNEMVDSVSNLRNQIKTLNPQPGYYQ
jgi:hypothetical protein